MADTSDDRFAWRLRVYPLVILLTLGLALVAATGAYDRDDPESRLGGDYPSFFAAGVIVADGDWDQLYDDGRQQEEQAGLIDDDGGYLYFSYPPFVAAAYGLLARLGYQWSFLLHTVLMAAALAGAIRALWPWLAKWRLPGPAVFVIALAFQPVLIAVTGGQNTTLSLLLFSVAARLDRDEHQFGSGLVASLLLYKPQFGIVALPLFLVARKWRAASGWMAGAVGLFLISTALMGGGWVGDWWSQAGSFSDTNLVANGANFISFPGFLLNALGDTTPVRTLAYGLALAAALGVAWYWWRSRGALTLWHWAIAAGAAIVVAPQTLFYDAGLLLIGLVVVLPRLRRPILVLTVLAALSWLQVAAPELGWSPLGPMALAGFVTLLFADGRSGLAGETPGRVG